MSFGSLEYREALSLQEKLIRWRQSTMTENVLMLLEHHPVFTIGRSGTVKNILVSKEVLEKERIQVCNTDRGGDVTYHGPGQLVGYFIFDLNENRDVLSFLHKVESSIISLLNEYGIFAHRERGIWFKDKKIAAVGMSVKNWITKHGFALNVNVDMNHFAMINPCGMSFSRVTSLKELLKRQVPLEEVRRKYLRCFRQTFNLEVEEATLYDLALKHEKT